MGSLKSHEVLNLATKPCPSARNETENRKAPVTPSCVYVRVCVFFCFLLHFYHARWRASSPDLIKLEIVCSCEEGTCHRLPFRSDSELRIYCLLFLLLFPLVGSFSALERFTYLSPVMRKSITWTSQSDTLHVETVVRFRLFVTNRAA